MAGLVSLSFRQAKAQPPRLEAFDSRDVESDESAGVQALRDDQGEFGTR